LKRSGTVRIASHVIPIGIRYNIGNKRSKCHEDIVPSIVMQKCNEKCIEKGDGWKTVHS